MASKEERIKAFEDKKYSKNSKKKGILKVCLTCKKEFYVYPSEITKKKFCSKECCKKKRIKKICKWCGKDFEVRVCYERIKFCSRDCYIAWRKENLVGEKATHWKGGGVKKICVVCGKEYTTKRSLAPRSKCCSCRCTGIYSRTKKMNIKPTIPERIYQEIVDNNSLPFKYTGDGSFWIENINPDFVECNGKKIVVEIFGDYWHSPLLNWGLSENRTLFYRKAILKQYGWKMIVFWESDLKRKDAEAFVLSILKKEKVI